MVEWLTSPQVPGPNWAVWWRKDTLRSWACGLWPHWAKTWAKKARIGSEFLTHFHTKHTEFLDANLHSWCLSCLHKFKTSMNLSFPGDFPAFGTPMMPISVRRVRRMQAWKLEVAVFWEADSGFNRLRRILNVAVCGAVWKTVCKEKNCQSQSHSIELKTKTKRY